jgi:hypothetical protein
MREGLLWYDASEKLTARQKIDDAARRFEERFKRAPNCCHVNPKEPADHPRLHVVADQHIRPHHYWVGVDESLVPARPARRRAGAA